jgi:type VI secretion system protein ImpL
VRLPWFRTGSIPDDIRLTLINALPQAVSRAVRAALVELLEQHPPPVDSVAAPRHQLDLAMQRLLSVSFDPDQRKALARTLDDLPERELQRDRVYIRLLEQHDNRALATLLPRRLRRSLHRNGSASRARRPTWSALPNIPRFALAGTAAAGVVLAFLVTISWLGNRALAGRVADAMNAVAALPVVAARPGTIVFPSSDALRRLDVLRAQLDTLRGQVKDGPPLHLRFGLWKGQTLLDAARPVYYEAFRRQLFAAGWGAMVDSLKALPSNPTTSSDYGDAYSWLKGYLITTKHPDSSTVAFLAPVLLKSWQRGLQDDSLLIGLARRQFEFYATELPTFNPFPQAADAVLVARSRDFLRRFTGGEQIYRNMLAAANKAVPPVQIPQAPGVLITTREVAGAFTAKGAAFIADAFRNADRYLRGEAWVIGDATTPASVDRAAIISAIRARYFEDYTNAWKQVIQSTAVTHPASVRDASKMLIVISGPQSPILQVLRTAATNTATDSAVRAMFQPVHAVTPPEVVDKFASESNAEYLVGLSGLTSLLQVMTVMPPPIDAQSTSNYVRAAKIGGVRALDARKSEKTMAQQFVITSSSAPVAIAVERLLLAPINAVEALLRTVESMKPPALIATAVNERGRALCSMMTPILAKFPFNPDSPNDASTDEVTALLAPGTGAIWAFQKGLEPFLEKQGGRWVAKPVGTVALSPAFVEFLNKAATVSAALFYKDSPKPALSWMARGITSSQTPQIVLKNGSRSARFDASTPRNEVVWPAEGGRDARLEATFKKNKPVTVASASGEWALFRLVYQARFDGAGRAEFNAPGKDVKDAVPVVVEFDALNALPGVPVLKRGWLGGMTCVSQVTR